MAGFARLEVAAAARTCRRGIRAISADIPAIVPWSRDDWKRFCRRVSASAQFFTLDDVCLWTQSKSCEHICCVCRYRGKVPGGGLSEGRAGCWGLGDSGLGAVAVVETAPWVCLKNHFFLEVHTSTNVGSGGLCPHLTFACPRQRYSARKSSLI